MDPVRGEWFAGNILVHEPALRRWLARFAGQVEIDDVVQETYAKIATADYLAIKRPKAFMFTVAHNIVMDGLRGRQVVPLDVIADLEPQSVIDGNADPERQVNTREEVALLRRAIAVLPGRCREVLILRKVEGLSQREVATRLGLSESTVEKHVAKGMRLCSQWFGDLLARSERPRIFSLSSRRRPAQK